MSATHVAQRLRGGIMILSFAPAPAQASLFLPSVSPSSCCAASRDPRSERRSGCHVTERRRASHARSPDPRPNSPDPRRETRELRSKSRDPRADAWGR
eukprot:3237980-Rhodomonas_salina.1